MENKQSLSLTKKDMNYLMSRKKIGNSVKIFNTLSSISKLVVGAGLSAIGILGHLELLTPMILGLSGTSMVTLGLVTMFGNVAAKQNKAVCDDVLDRVKLIAQQHNPERLINGQTFTIVRSNNIESNLKNYSFEEQKISFEGDKIVKEVERDDLQVGTVSKQYVLSDCVGTIGAIEETKTSDIERRATETGSRESVVSTYSYKWCDSNEVRPYNNECTNPKTKKRK